MREIAKYTGFGLATLFVAWWSYHELLGFSASLAVPEFMLVHYKAYGVDHRYEFLFMFLTWYLPYALVAALVTFGVSKYVRAWFVPVLYLLVLIYLRGFNYGFWYWLSMVALVLSTTSLILVYILRRQSVKATT